MALELIRKKSAFKALCISSSRSSGFFAVSRSIRLYPFSARTFLIPSWSTVVVPPQETVLPAGISSSTFSVTSFEFEI